MKFRLITGSLVLALCAGFAPLSYSTAHAPPSINISAFDFKHEYQHDLRAKRPWLNPARAALNI